MTNGAVQNIHNISATQLFQNTGSNASSHGNIKLKRYSTSTPTLQPFGASSHTRNTPVVEPGSPNGEEVSRTLMLRSFTPCPRRKYMPHEAYFDQSYWNARESRTTGGGTSGRVRAASVGAIDSCYESVNRNSAKQQNRSEYYEDVYKKVQNKLKKHLRREEVFSHEEIEKACYEIRKQAKDIVLSDRWQDEVNSGMDGSCSSDGLHKDVLQAVYLLRNSHRKNLFTTSSQESLPQSSTDGSSVFSMIDNNSKEAAVVVSLLYFIIFILA